MNSAQTSAIRYYKTQIEKQIRSQTARKNIQNSALQLQCHYIIYTTILKQQL